MTTDTGLYTQAADGGDHEPVPAEDVARIKDGYLDGREVYQLGNPDLTEDPDDD